MELINNRFEQLEQSLIDAYRVEPDLNRMFRYTFGKGLQIVVGGTTQRDRIFNLIEWADAQGKVVELIRGAHRNNPTNKQLKNFCEAYSFDLSNDACQNNLSVIPSETLDFLIQIPLFSAPFQKLLDAGCAALPSGASDDTKDMDWADFNNKKLTPVISFYGFLKLALTEFPQREGLPTLLLFARELAQSLPEHPSLQKDLSEWIQQVETECGISSQPSPVQQSILRQTGTLEVALMITVRLYSKQQQGKALRYQVDSYLHFDQITGSIPPQLEPRPPLKLSLTDPDSQPNVVCHWEQVPGYTDKFLQVAKEQLNHRLKRELAYKNYKLTVEFFLPIKYMGADVDQWPISSSSREIPIGTVYGVIVRFCDRIDDDERYNLTSIAWEQLQTVLKTVSSDELLSLYFETPTDLSQYSSWRQLEVNLKQKLGLKLCCGLPESDAVQKGLFEAILFGDIPIAVWTRENGIVERNSDSGEVNPINISEALTPLLAGEYFNNPANLAEQLKRIRLLAWAEESEMTQGRCLGHQVSLMLDNPYRSPLLPQLSS